MYKFLTLFSYVVMTGILFTGCAQQSDTAAPANSEQHDHDHEGHDHEGHDHDHEGHDHDEHADIHGPNGGHMFKFDSGDKYQGEWTHSNANDIIRVYVLDSTGKKPVPVKAEVSVVPMAGADKTPFELEPDAANDAGESAVYSLDDKNLFIAFSIGVKIEMKVGEEVYVAKIDAHEPHDH